MFAWINTIIADDTKKKAAADQQPAIAAAWCPYRAANAADRSRHQPQPAQNEGNRRPITEPYLMGAMLGSLGRFVK